MTWVGWFFFGAWVLTLVAYVFSYFEARTAWRAYFRQQELTKEIFDGWGRALDGWQYTIRVLSLGNGRGQRESQKGVDVGG